MSYSCPPDTAHLTMSQADRPSMTRDPEMMGQRRLLDGTLPLFKPRSEPTAGYSRHEINDVLQDGIHKVRTSQTDNYETSKAADRNELGDKTAPLSGPGILRQATEPGSELDELEARRRFIKFWKPREIEPEEDRIRRKSPNHEPFTLKNQLAATFLESWVRLLLLLTPVGFAVHYAKRSATTDFFVNFFAVLPVTDMFGQGLVEFKMWAQDPRLEWIAYVLCA